MALEESDGVAIESDPELRGGWNVKTLHEVATDPRELAWLIGFQEHVPAPATLDPLDRARRGTDYCDFVAGAGRNELAQPFAGVDGQLRGRLFDQTAENNICQTHVRGIGRIFPPLELLAHEGRVVVSNCVPHGMVTGQSRLDEDLSALRAATGSSRDLTQELEATLGRAKIREVDSDIGVDDPDQGDVGEVETFGDHLRAEQNVDFPGSDAIKNSGVRPFATRGVYVHPGNPRRRKPLYQQTFDLLGAKSALLEISSSTARAIGSRILLVEAIVADEPLRIPVVGKRDAAVRARRHRSAVDTLNKRGIPAAIEEQDALLAAGHRFDDCIVEGLADDDAVVHPALGHRRVINGCLSQIDDVDDR